MHSTPSDQQLTERLNLIDTSDSSDTTVADLPLRDFLWAVVTLVAMIALLTWWAY